MQVTIRQAPAFGVARCALAPGEQLKAETGAMMSMSADMAVEAKMQGGLMGALKRSVAGGESLFVTTFTAGPQGGFVDVAANLPGDLLQFDVQPNRGLVVQRGSWLASDAGVAVDTKWGGFKNLFGGEGGFVLHATGQGVLVASCYGAMELYQLAAGQRLVVDTNHMVAYEDTVQYTLRKVTGGAIQSMKSGEGLVFEFAGPGRVWTQTRSPNALVDWLTMVLPFTRS
jgi:uncharacterized protein (TIGR00266 family)